MPASRSLVVKIRSDWQVGPFWVSHGVEDVPEPYLPEEISEVLPLTPELIAEFEEWDLSFQNTFRPDNPAESGFRTEEETRAFDAQGRLLARKVKATVSAEVAVQYVPMNGDRAEEIPG